MGKTEENNSLIDIFDLDHTKYQDSEVEEVVRDAGDAEKVATELEGEDLTGEAQEVDGGAIGENLDSEQDDDEKQVAASEGEQEDASSQNEDLDEPLAQEEDSDDLGEVFQSLADEGVLLFDEEKEYETTPEGFKELIEDTKVKASSQAINSFKEELPDEGKQLLEVLDKGGSVQDFLNMNQQVNFSQVPTEDSSGNELVQNQAYLVEDWMKIQGYEQNEIEDKIRDLHETGLLSKEAKMSRNKLAQHQERQNSEMMAKMEEERVQREQEESAQAEEFKKDLLNTDEIAGFKISKKQREGLYDYITKPVGPEGETQFALDDSPENRLLYAYFAKTGFDKNALTKEVATKQAIKLKKNLSRFKDSTSSMKGESVRRDSDDNGKKGINLPNFLGM